MKTGQAKVSSDLDARINEAEVCRSMGLYDESLEIYEQILGGIPASDSKILENIKSKIAEVKKEITDQEQKDSTRVSAKDISMLKKTLSSSNPVAISSAVRRLSTALPVSKSWVYSVRLSMNMRSYLPRAIPPTGLFPVAWTAF